MAQHGLECLGKEENKNDKQFPGKFEEHEKSEERDPLHRRWNGTAEHFRRKSFEGTGEQLERRRHLHGLGKVPACWIVQG